MQERLNDIALLGKLDYMLAFQRQHNDQFSDDISQFGYTRLVEPQEVIQNVHIDEDGVRVVLALHCLSVPAANRVELSEKGRGSFSARVEKYVFEKSPHEMEVVEAKAGVVCFFGEEKYDLAKVIPDEAFV